MEKGQTYLLGQPVCFGGRMGRMGGRAVSVVGSVVGRNFWQDRSALGKKCYKAYLPWDGSAFRKCRK